jgi:hypothetical protein
MLIAPARLATTPPRLTVVSAGGMVGTIVTISFWHGIYSHSDLQTPTKLIIFAVFFPTLALCTP